MAQRERIKWLDALKLFAIFTVLWQHSLVGTDNGTGPVFCFIGTFHMPLFMTLSGFFSAKYIQLPWREAFGKKFRQLLLPTLCLGILPALCIQYATNAGGGYAEIWKSSFWFTRSAFICSMFYYVAYRYKNCKIPVLIAAFTIWIYGIWWMYPCFVLGGVIYKHLSWFQKNIIHILIISGLLYIAMLLTGNSRFYDHEGYLTIPAAYDDGQIGTWLSVLAALRFYRILIGMIASTFFIALFAYFSRRIPAAAWWEKICEAGQYTLGVYILQTFLLEMFLSKYLPYNTFSYWTYNLVIAPLTALGVLVVCLAMIKVIHKSQWASYLLLGEPSPLARHDRP